MDALANEPEQIDLSDYNYTWGNPINLTDPDGNCPWCIVLGAMLIGGGVDYGTQVAGNYINQPTEQKDVKQAMTQNISGSSIAISAVASGLTAGTGEAAILSASAGKKFWVEGAINVGESLAKQYADAGKVTLDQTISDVTLSFAAGKATSKIEGPVNISVLERQADRTKRVAANDPQSSGRKAAADQAKVDLNRGKAVNKTAQNAASEPLESVFQKTSDNLRMVPDKISARPTVGIQQDNTRVPLYPRQ